MPVDCAEHAQHDRHRLPIGPLPATAASAKTCGTIGNQAVPSSPRHVPHQPKPVTPCARKEHRAGPTADFRPNAYCSRTVPTYARTDGGWASQATRHQCVTTGSS
ncbi:hypothetical protein BIFGAL_03265 [Bifidobacterium gallicum DSM 20093 = LMG 11596]|uniref:Uncharacterized protein n=1 Tax=Bifidobacterium gallicum DSM 20093 = LMG 11596 TaxID=561180 RepID=D1NTU8_9BIFI|nr:hypothetical protein BIFGAL_03265 [Bifidobacterium gallicum DSM 20093 = LMG 11596]